MFKCCGCQWVFVSSGTVCVKLAQMCSRASHEQSHAAKLKCVLLH